MSRTIPIRRSANRVNLFMGGDREMVMFSGLISFILIFILQDVFSFLIGAGFWVYSLRILRKMASSDPYFRYVYLRQRGYSPYYAPRATPFRINSQKQAGQYK